MLQDDAQEQLRAMSSAKRGFAPRTRKVNTPWGWSTQGAVYRLATGGPT